MKNKGNDLDFRDWGTIVSYLEGMAVEALAVIFLVVIGLLLAVVGHLLRR